MHLARMLQGQTNIPWNFYSRG